MVEETGGGGVPAKKTVASVPPQFTVVEKEYLCYTFSFPTLTFCLCLTHPLYVNFICWPLIKTQAKQKCPKPSSLKSIHTHTHTHTHTYCAYVCVCVCVCVCV